MGFRYFTRLHKEWGLRPPRPPRASFGAYSAFTAAAAALHGAVWLGLAAAAGMPAFLAYLFAANGAALLLCGYDKAIAGTGATRAPEIVLLAFAFAGGSGGLLVGVILFRHKTRKPFFIVLLTLIMTAQVRMLQVTGGGETLISQWRAWRLGVPALR